MENIALSVGPPSREYPFSWSGAIPSLCLERAARVWCKPETQNYEMQPEIAKIIARLIFGLEEAIFELAKISPDIKVRAEAIVTIRAALDLAP